MGDLVDVDAEITAASPIIAVETNDNVSSQKMDPIATATAAVDSTVASIQSKTIIEEEEEELLNLDDATQQPIDVQHLSLTLKAMMTIIIQTLLLYILIENVR